ncbi:MAG: glycosyltransferase [Acidimicrobiales bacterium]
MGDATLANVDECSTLAGARHVTFSIPRVALDLDGSLESLGNSMIDLADALATTGECSLVRFHSSSRPSSKVEANVALRRLYGPLWRRGLGPSVDRRFRDVDVVHVAGRATPPTKRVPLIISVDDLRPLRGESREHQRIEQLRRSVRRGALLVASTRSAASEVQRVLEVKRSSIAVVPPAVPLVEPTIDGTTLVVNLTGVAEAFMALAPSLVAFAARFDSRVVALTSASVAQRVRAGNLAIQLRPRREARAALAQARVVLHISDGARFPSFAIAALEAGVPTIARATTINRELLDGAALLSSSDADVIPFLEELWTNPSRRSIAVAAGKARAQDFSPATAAVSYVALYREVVRGWTP